MISAKCKFNGVGQGLFYSASISDGNSRVFNFVYDCGTFYDKNKNLLSEKICNCFPEDKIDALFISHFHKDHISGIPELIKKYKVNYVFLPFFTKEELILLRKKYGFEITDELYSFYTNPTDYFGDRVERIYVISGNNNDNLNDNYFRSLDHDERFTNSDEENGFHIRTRVEDTTTNKQGTPVVKCSDVSIKLYGLNWHFKIYQDQDYATQLRIKNTIIEEYRSKFGEEFTEDSVAAITDTDKIKLCKDIYNKVKYGINQSSLVLCHYPDSSIDCYTTVDLKHLPNCCKKCCWHCQLKYVKKVATLLTGDINMNCLSDNKNRFKEFLKSAPVKIGYFQLPHHGSRNNSSVDAITSLSLQNTNMICSYGRKNQFKHPDPYLLYKLNKFCNHIFHVNNDESFVYQIIEDK